MCFWLQITCVIDLYVYVMFPYICLNILYHQNTQFYAFCIQKIKKKSTQGVR